VVEDLPRTVVPAVLLTADLVVRRLPVMAVASEAEDPAVGVILLYEDRHTKKRWLC